MFCSIYKISNCIDNKVYVGQTWKSISERFIEHGYPTACIKLSNAIQKYGKENFRVEFITLAHTQEVANYWEIYWIEKFNSQDRDVGYNIRGGGSRGKIAPETKLKISFAKTGKKQSEEHRNKVSKAMSGRIFSEEHKKNLSEAKKGKFFSEEHKAKLSESGKIKAFSEEHRMKLSEAGKKRIQSPKTRAKISQSLKNNKRSLEQK